MGPYSRRDFLKSFAAAAAVIGARQPTYGDLQSNALRFLVVGDSLAWGQGLEEKDKFYNLTAEWLRNNAFGRERKVELKVKAHSGSTLKLHDDTAAKFKKVGRSETVDFHPEVNVGFPSIWKQIETSAAEYKSAGTRGAHLIMLSGGITDISVSKVLDPFGDNKDLPPLIERYCRDDMLDVLEHAAKHHSDASIVVLGYFPMISESSSKKKVLNGWLESMDFPGGLKPVANNSVTRKLFFGRIRSKAISRSRLWVEHSNKNIQEAVDRFNRKLPAPRAIFVKSPITEATAYATPNSLVFGMGSNGMPDDPLASRRAAECKKVLPGLKKSSGVDYPVRLCEMAGAGHPDPAGSRAYFDEIRNALGNDASLIRRLAAVR
jgi:hypothetical protein